MSFHISMVPSYFRLVGPTYQGRTYTAPGVYGRFESMYHQLIQVSEAISQH